MRSTFFLSFLLLQLAFLRAGAQVRPDDITGIWQTHGDKPAKISIYKNGGKYYGKIVYLQFPLKDGKPLTDINNPDKSKQTQPILGLEILKDFRFDEDEWNKGEIYDPQSGKTYSCTLSLKDNQTLKVHGYVGISLLGRTDIWTRAN